MKNSKHVEKITIIPKADSWSKLKNEMSLPNIENPLPDTLHVKVDSPENIQPIFDHIKTIPAVEDMSYAKDLASKIELVNHVVKTITLVVIGIMALLTITIINNTIQLVIQSRKEEIEIMRLMGVSNWYIKCPLVLQGAIYGFLGALLACYTNQYCPKIFSSNACAFFYSGVWLCTGACSIIRNSYGCDIFSRRKLDEYQKALAGLDLCQIIQMI